MGALLWNLSSKRDAPTVEVAVFDAAPSEMPEPIVVKRRTHAPSDAAAAPSNEVLDPQSEEFSHRLDVGIPDRFRASLARCDRRDFDPDAKLTLSYTLHIEGGEVSASNVQIEKSDLDDSELETCMVRAVQDARWQAKDLPDTKEEQDLFIRIRSLDKYLSADEQEANKDEANLN